MFHSNRVMDDSVDTGPKIRDVRDEINVCDAVRVKRTGVTPCNGRKGDRTMGYLLDLLSQESMDFNQTER